MPSSSSSSTSEEDALGKESYHSDARGDNDNDNDNDNDDDSSDESSENDQDEDPLQELVERMGFPIAQASAALLECQGNVEQAKQQLLQAAAATAAADANDKNQKSSLKKKKGKGKNKQSSAATAASNHDASNEKQQFTAATTPTPPTAKKNKSFKEQRKADLRFQKALRDQKRVCRVCGGPHARKECPGIADDGRGHSRHYDLKRSRKKEKAKRQHFQQERQKDQAFLEIGKWTADILYYDGYADLVQAYYNRNAVLGNSSGFVDDIAGAAAAGGGGGGGATNEEVGSENGLVQWILDWATLDNVRLGEDPIHNLTPEQRKLELKTWAGSRLQKTARALLATSSSSSSSSRKGGNDNNNNSGTIVDAALKDRNPRAALIQIIMDAHTNANDNNNDDNHQQQNATPERTLSNEWPGYRGCVCPFSVLDSHAMAALDQLQNRATTQQHKIGVKAVLSIPPADVAKWMIVDQEDGGGDSESSSSSFLPVDLAQFTKNALDMEKTQVAAKRAQDQLVAAKAGSGKKSGRASAEAELMRLRKALAGKLSRKVNGKELLYEASKARLNPSVLKSLDEALDRYNGQATTTTTTTDPTKQVVVGISCGLNYDTAEARHPLLGEAVRAAQKEACRHAIQVAVKANLPVALECQDAKEQPQQQQQQQLQQETDAEKLLDYSCPLASADLIRLLVDTAPPATTLLLRTGSLTTAPKPGLAKIMQTWPHLHVAVSAALAFSKCPKELIDVVFDVVPLARIVLTSESPHCMPPLLSGSHLVDDCLPPHAACIAETVATIKLGGGGAAAAAAAASSLCSREQVLRQCSETTQRVFGFGEDEQEKSIVADKPE